MLRINCTNFCKFYTLKTKFDFLREIKYLTTTPKEKYPMSVDFQLV